MCLAMAMLCRFGVHSLLWVAAAQALTSMSLDEYVGKFKNSVADLAFGAADWVDELESFHNGAREKEITYFVEFERLNNTVRSEVENELSEISLLNPKHKIEHASLMK